VPERLSRTPSCGLCVYGGKSCRRYRPVCPIAARIQGLGCLAIGSEVGPLGHARPVILGILKGSVLRYNYSAMTTMEKPLVNYRQKTLLGLLSAFDGHLPRLDFQKYLFLYTKEFEVEPSFEFVPYRFGGFSFQSYADKRRLVEIRALEDSDDWRLRSEADSTDDLFGNDSFSRFYVKYSHLKGDSLVRDIYRRYPFYAINSEIASRLMNKKELETISSKRPNENEPCLFTIGYEGSSFEGYINRLIKNNVKTLVDVRRNPLSRKYGFSKKTLSETITKLGIEYIHIPELGIASDKRRNLNSQAAYDRLFISYEKNELKENCAALHHLNEIVKDRKRVAITCFEANVCMCHRGSVAKALSQLPGWQCNIGHI
jgi:hypothetical protein